MAGPPRAALAGGIGRLEDPHRRPLRDLTHPVPAARAGTCGCRRCPGRRRGAGLLRIGSCRRGLDRLVRPPPGQRPALRTPTAPRGPAASSSPFGDRGVSSSCSGRWWRWPPAASGGPRAGGPCRPRGPAAPRARPVPPPADCGSVPTRRVDQARTLSGRGRRAGHRRWPRARADPSRPGFYASPGGTTELVREHPDAPGSPRSSCTTGRHRVVELETGADLHVRLLLADVDLPSSTMLERLVTGPGGQGLKPAADLHAAMVASWPSGASWPPAPDVAADRVRVRRIRRIAGGRHLRGRLVDLRRRSPRRYADTSSSWPVPARRVVPGGGGPGGAGRDRYDDVVAGHAPGPTAFVARRRRLAGRVAWHCICSTPPTSSRCSSAPACSSCSSSGASCSGPRPSRPRC